MHFERDSLSSRLSQKFCSQKWHKDLRRDNANRLLLGIDFQGNPLDEFKKMADEDTEVRARVLQSHAISDEAWEALLANDPVGFVEARRKKMKEKELAFMRRKGVMLKLDGSDESDALVDDAED